MSFVWEKISAQASSSQSFEDSHGAKQPGDASPERSLWVWALRREFHAKKYFGRSFKDTWRQSDMGKHKETVYDNFLRKFYLDFKLRINIFSFESVSEKKDQTSGLLRER